MSTERPNNGALDELLNTGATEGDSPPGRRERREGASSSGRRKKRLRERTGLLVTLGVLGALVVGLGVVVGYYGLAVLDAMNSVIRDPEAMPDPEVSRPAPVETSAGATAVPVNIVLMGSDTRGGERGRSDVLQLVHIPGDRSAIYLMSIPRDTWVEIPGRGEAKVNAAYSYGGAALTVQTLEQLFEVPMDHTVVVDFEGFVAVIDAIGGVVVQNDHASGSGGFVFPKGPVALTGESALVYVRERYNVPGGDLGRAERQRDVIMAVVSKLASGDVLTNPGTFRDAVTTLGPNFTVDAGLDNARLFDLAWDSRGAVGAMRSFQLPITGLGTSADGQSIVVKDDVALGELREALRGDEMAEFYVEWR